ncbi:hypothetical protein OQ252_07045 [Acetobacter farinalis]|uniref:Uncharacterized protein n=1 Tax=Acetobacter farinalis TaxID=1260984 RepID=A0ABT3Q796_9PROT|nr:hypothetical protein [Acetobacter farinalis]MCX2561152.1 hypothetical protein [Acetobacter farinalis]NHO29877.1 hypothetical protein [Acetobacter farinalis]
MTDCLSKVFSFAVLGGLLITSPAALAYRKWEKNPFSYIAVDQNISSVLKEFSYINDLSINISEKIHGQVRGRWLNITSEDFLQKMSRLYDFDWYDDGGALYVSSKSERSTQIVPLHDHSLSQLRVEMQRLGLFDERFELNAGPANDTAVISGPPRFIAMVQQTLQSLSPEARPVRRSSDNGRHLTLFRGSSVSDIVVH